MYFVTIYTKNRIHYFGEIEEGKMILSEIGEIAQQVLSETQVHFPFASLDEFIVMPDHIHAIIIIKELQKNQTITGQNDDLNISSQNDGLMGIIVAYH